MTLEERYNKAKLQELVSIIENKDDYTKDCIDVVSIELKNRNTNKDVVEIIAEEILRANFKLFLITFVPYNTRIKEYNSEFVSKERIVEIQKEEFDKWQERKELFEFDVWNYAIGGAL